MADNKAAEVGAKANEKAEEGDKKVRESVVKVENSGVGQKIPTHIEKIEFKDILLFTLVLGLVLTIPAYLMISEKVALADGKLARLFMRIAKYVIIIVGLLGAIFDLVVILMKQDILLKVVMLMKAVKMVTLLISIFFLPVGGMLSKGLLVFYILGAILVDAMFIYYSVLYFNRLKSDDYDDEGNPKNQGHDQQV